MFKFRSKVAIVAFVSVLLLTVLVYLAWVRPAARRTQERAHSDVVQAAALVERIQRLHAYDLVALAKDASLQEEFLAAIALGTEDERRQAVYDAITEFDRKLRQENRKPDFFAVIDAQGKVIARDLNIEDMHGDRLAHPAIKSALLGRSASDLWFMKNRMMRVGVAPISDEGEIKGAVVLAYDITAAQARLEAALLRTQIVYFMKSAIRASSFVRKGAEDSSRVKLLSKQLLGKDGPASMALAGKAQAEPVSMEVAGRTYLAIAGPLPPPVSIGGIELATKLKKGSKNGEGFETVAYKDVGFAVLVDMHSRMSPVTTARYLMLALVIALLILVYVVMWSVAQHFVNAEDRLELGVNEIINGNMEYTFGALQEFEGLANALNVMLARLLGRPEPGEEEEGSTAWRPDMLAIEEISHGVTDVDVQQLAAEPEEAYHARLFQEYMAARSSAGLSVEGITAEGFCQKLRANEAMLKARHKSNMVRFVVHSSAGQVSLRPIRIG